MADTKISALTELTAPSSSTAIPAIDPGTSSTTNYKMLAADVSAWLGLLVLTTTSQTTNYTVVLADAGSMVEMNSASALTFTIPPNSSVAFPVGTEIQSSQMGAGQVTITPGAGVTIRTASSLTSRAQYSDFSVRKRATNEWVASGDLT
jgi:hypothetical protein